MRRFVFLSILFLLIIGIVSAGTVNREVSGTFPQKADGPPFPLKAGELTLDVDGDLDPIKENLTLRSLGIIDEEMESADRNPPRWWDNNSGTFSSVDNVSSATNNMSKNHTRVLKHPDFSEKTVEDIKIEAAAYANSQSKYDDKSFGADAEGKLYQVNLSVANGTVLTKDLNLSAYASNHYYTTGELVVDRKDIIYNFSSPTNVTNISLRGYTFNECITDDGGEQCSTGGGAIADVTLYKDAGFYKHIPRLEGDQFQNNLVNPDDHWNAKNLVGGTYSYRVNVSEGPIKLRKDDILFCSKDKVLIESTAISYGAYISPSSGYPSGTFPSFCLDDWKEESEYGLKDCSEDVGDSYKHGGCHNRDWNYANNIYDEDGTGEGEPREQLNTTTPETNVTLFNQTSNSSGYHTDVTTLEENYIPNDSIEYQEWENNCGHGCSDPDRPDKFYPWPGYINESLVLESVNGTNATVERFMIQRIWPTGNTWLEVDGEFFGGANNTIENNTVVENQTNSSVGWITAKSFDLNFRRRTRMKITGEYWQNVPDTLQQENYRFIHNETNYTLFEYNNLEDPGNSYIEKEEFYNLKSSSAPSGLYKLQMKANDGSSNVRLRQRDFQIEFDEDIKWNETKDFNLDLEVGTNNLVFYTQKSSVMEYNITWQECINPMTDEYPANNTYVPKLKVNLSIKIECERGLDVSFMNADSDSLIDREYNVGMNEIARSNEMKLVLGKEYRWYGRVCDNQTGSCHRTGVFNFTVGTSSTASTSFNATSPPKAGDTVPLALDKIIRDEDFNETGNQTSTDPYQNSEGYINKLEEVSDQYEPSATSVFDRNPPDIWTNSNGTQNNSDQYAITPSRSWVVSNRGEPYPPFGVYHRDQSDFNIDKDTDKSDKVFGNSLAVVADGDLTDGSGNLIAVDGSGLWIDPDGLGANHTDYLLPGDDWYDILIFEQRIGNNRERLVGLNMDMTGEDSGIGVDNGSTDKSAPPIDGVNEKIRAGDIYFHGESP